MPDDEIGQYYLPGVGVTYLHPQFADKIADFIIRAENHNIQPTFRYGYRTQSEQDAMHNDPAARTPAKNSLHSAGRAVDIHAPRLPNGNVDKAAFATLIAEARQAGLHWGGNFSDPDPNHFYSDPGDDRIRLIDNFSQAIAARKDQIPDY